MNRPAGTFNPEAAMITGIRTATAAQIAAGSVTLTLTTNDPAGTRVSNARRLGSLDTSPRH